METETVTRLRAVLVTDPYSAQTTAQSWTAPTSLSVTTVAPPEPRLSTEPNEAGRSAVLVGWTLYVPSGTDVTSGDRMRVRGKDYPVDGEPADWGMGLVVQTTLTVG